ncbi:hypothetical protein PKHYL_26590 [Psychrobacter sp. KH172YL61]|uniref:phage tail protein n=1 Tax=Psychrobacter sp. KH172YL61 TaxID=2517899 RepID=UPI0010B38064|nr:phage tail protein [Psychrobacter sp. KH172YL61]BBI68468.1 hypothetical protein PKHYL_26590 [Psychrobacter sp. KH172YL61]
MITHLGDINLGDVRGAHGLSLRTGYDFAKHERPLNKAIKQKLGARLDEWRLSFKLHHAFCDPQVVLDKILTTCNKGEPMPLVFDYVDYKGWVTLDDVDVNYQEIAPNGKPLVITGSLSLSEFTGDTTTKPTAPAVRDDNQSLSNPVPVQTATSDNVSELLPTRQPMQHLEDALIAQHRARALIRTLSSASSGDFSAINNATSIVNGYFASNDWTGNTVPPLPIIDSSNYGDLSQILNDRQAVMLELTRSAATRQSL